MAGSGLLVVPQPGDPLPGVDPRKIAMSWRGDLRGRVRAVLEEDVMNERQSRSWTICCAA